MSNISGATCQRPSSVRNFSHPSMHNSSETCTTKLPDDHEKLTRKYMELIRTRDKVQQQQQVFVPGDEPLPIKSICDDIHNIKGGIKDCLQLRRYQHNLYRKYNDKIKVKNKIKQYEDGEIDLKEIEALIKQQ